MIVQHLAYAAFEGCFELTGLELLGWQRCELVEGAGARRTRASMIFSALAL